ncbi:CAP domain-containing protein, partial [Pilaira anomala]
SILSLHNQLRSSHNSPDLKWDYVLAHRANRFTDECEYNKSNINSLKLFNAVDNVAQGYYHWNQTIQAWYGGHKHYDFKNPGYKENAGTFITMIWKDTTRIGCSKTICSGTALYQCIY